MLDYKDIITKYYGIGMSSMAIVKSLSVSPFGINDFLRACSVTRLAWCTVFLIIPLRYRLTSFISEFAKHFAQNT